MENSDNITADRVLSKLKDDGYFDKLRLKIIRQLKDNEELQNSIIAMVKQSDALSRPSAENLKPRQLSDAIHEEVGDRLMSQISDSLWGIIRSPDGMKKEITETVESIYNKLLNPMVNENKTSLSINGMARVQNQEDNTTKHTKSPSEVEDLSDSEPPGFSSSNNNQNNQQLKQPKEEPVWDMTYSTTISEKQTQDPRQLREVKEHDVEDQGPPGFFTMGSFKQPIDIVDDDPDVPPGFG